MIVLLRDLKTGLYFGRENVWVGKPEAATDFGTVEAAGRGAWECVGEDVAVVLRYDNPECELALNPAFCMAPLPRARPNLLLIRRSEDIGDFPARSVPDG